MSEETAPAKKAARKSVRKKSAKKATSTKSENPKSSDELPLDISPGIGESAQKTDSEGEGKPRGPKSGVRDARREKSPEPEAVAETVEKLVPGSDQKESRDSKNSKDQSRQRERGDQDSSENGDRRGRNRTRNNRGRNDRGDRNERREEPARPEINLKKLKKKAWEIFESEVTEEGLALLDDNGLREYARSSFNASRIFLEEAGRQVGRRKNKKTKAKKNTDAKRETSDSKPEEGERN